MIRYIEESEEIHKNDIRTISNFSKVVRHKINIPKKKNQLYFYILTTNQTLKLNMKYLGINLTKDTQNMYTKNYKLLLK